jgi:hypothetical protein
VLISSVLVRNYKSYFDSGEIKLTQGFNVVVGRNNAGKTALLEACSLQFQSKHHRSLRTQPTRNTPLRGAPEVEVAISLSPKEVDEIIRESVPDIYLPLAEKIELPSYELIAQDLLQRDQLYLATFQYNTVAGASLDGWPGRYGNTTCVHFSYNGPGSPLVRDPSTTSRDVASQFPATVASILRQRAYLFKAERLNVGAAQFGVQTELRADASNLPEVVNNLQRNPRRFDRYKKLVKSVFPDVSDVSIRASPTDAHMLEILVWTVDPAEERDDLAIPLAESGTGIGQVMAMLYVALNAEYPRCIAIDEPQSFLHPDAVRRLFSVLQSTPLSQHQYIVATHSPNTVAVADPTSVLLVRRDGSESKVLVVDRRSTEGARLVLAEVGARLSDVFGADAILWVEGATEEVCYPLILATLTGGSLGGVKILGLTQVGDLKAKRRPAMLEAYRKLSTSSGLIPPAVGFLLDRETSSPSEIEDFKRRSANLFSFIERRMYENYLLHADAIAKVLDGAAKEAGVTLGGPTVAERLERARSDNECMGGLKAPEAGETREWLRDVDGAQLLEKIFADLSGGKLGYHKIEHGVAITKWLLEKRPKAVEEVADSIEKALEAGGQVAQSGDSGQAVKAG